MSMQNVKVVLELSTPAVVREPIMLDGLLAYCLCEQGMSLDEALEAMPLKTNNLCGHRFFSASRFIYRHVPAIPAIQTKRTPIQGLVEYSNGTRMVDAGRGSAKSFFNPIAMHHIHYAVAYCVGDLASIHELVQGITSFGGMRHSGYGKVISAKAVACEHDYSTYINDCLVRPIPAEIGDADVVAGIAPPYWDRATWIPVLMPDQKNPRTGDENELLY